MNPNPSEIGLIGLNNLGRSQKVWLLPLRKWFKQLEYLEWEPEVGKLMLMFFNR